MKPGEELARLNPKNQMFSEPSPGASPEDIAASMAGLSDGPYYLCRVKYCGDETSIPKLMAAAIDAAKKRAKKYAYPDKMGKTISSLVRLGIYENIETNKCPVCRGTGDNLSEDKPQPGRCPFCNGDGRIESTDEFRAEIAEIPINEFRAAKKFYFRIVDMISGWEMHGLSHINKRLSSIDKSA